MPETKPGDETEHGNVACITLYDHTVCRVVAHEEIDHSSESFCRETLSLVLRGNRDPELIRMRVQSVRPHGDISDQPRIALIIWSQECQLSPLSCARQAHRRLPRNDEVCIREREVGTPGLIAGDVWISPIGHKDIAVRSRQETDLEAFRPQDHGHEVTLSRGQLRAVSKDPAHVLGTLRVPQTIVEPARTTRGDGQLPDTATHAFSFDFVYEGGAEVESSGVFVHDDLLQLGREAVRREQSGDCGQCIATNTALIILRNDEMQERVVASHDRCEGLVEDASHGHEGSAKLAHQVEDRVSILCADAPDEGHDQRPKLPR